MATRAPLVLGADGLPQQLQLTDNLASGGTTPSATSANAALGNGYILKAGQLTITNGTGTLTFPVRFPTACIVVTCNVFNASGTVTSSVSTIITAYSATAFTVDASSLGGSILGVTALNGTVLWQAIGY